MKTWMFLFLLCPLASHAATTVYHNGQVPVSDGAGTIAEWIAVEDGKVLGFGMGKHYESYADAKLVDVGGKWIVPDDRGPGNPLKPGQKVSLRILGEGKPKPVQKKKP